MKKDVLVYGALTVFIVTTVLWGFNHYFEYHEEVRDIGMSSQARRNPYLAAERFLKKFDMRSRVISSMLQMKSLPPTSDVLLIPTGRYDLSAEKINELLDWVRKGGHLILRARRTAGSDMFFNRLGVKTYHEKKKKLFSKTHYAVVNVHVSKKIENKKVTFDSDVWLKKTGKKNPSWYVEGKNGNQLLEYHIGEGYISLLSDLDFMNNEHIAKHDNAAFLYTLVHMQKDNHALWLIANDDMPSLLSIIWHKTPASVVSLLVLIVFWLWYTTRRLGPLLTPASLQRRSLREHITASGLYQWRNQNRTSLFLSVRAALIEQLAQTRPQWTRLSEQELADKLAYIAGVGSERILPVLQAKTADRENEFTQYIEILSIIRKRL